MTLWLYLGRKFLLTVAGTFLVFFGVMFLIDLVEQVRRGANDGLSDAAWIAFLHSPQGVYEILPLVVLLGAIALFLALARTSELVVIRAVGVWVFEALSPALIGGLIVGMLAVTVLNPIASATSRKADASAEGGGDNIVSVSGEAIWLRQGDRAGQWVIRAERATPEGTELFNAIFIGLDTEGTPVRRVEATHAVLGRGAWELTGVKDWPMDAPNPEKDAERHETLTLNTNLTQQEIRNSFEAPGMISFWQLPEQIRRLERAGFSSRSHKVLFHMELATPFLIVAMIQIAAGFTMQPARAGRTGVKVLIAVLLGFALFFLRNFAQILGNNGQIPVLLAAWGPPIAGLLFSAGLLLHMEDG
ncbi:permease [Haematobacter missouriensis]|uniref:LPS export ABC transporter permease LptG n=1 Tax=Haematobacter missouriensis TaxID=366616 RepID=A0A212AX71_9RHOB|nr:LPS export ABC transporter permease LptG [Haematobacter missouriensis]KFI34075.1 permease [Haematobacter missouriensis]OWJ78315.1 LPS export ABC transporter permease LptG [Haematobacter missouriensis]OWJ86064.1 LPS export ABC transporter permease LptG [Haematobacter missouriensis]